MSGVVELEPVVPFDAAAHHVRKRQLRDSINEVTGLRNLADGRLVDVAIELLADDTLYSGPGTETVEKFLAWQGGLTVASAKKYVDVARRADELPATMRALRAGEISLDQVMPIVQWVPAWADQQFVTQAVKLTPRQVSRLARTYPFATPPDQVDTIGHPTRLQSPDETGESTTEVPGDEADHAESDTRSGPADGSPVDSERMGASVGRPPADIGWCGVGDDGRWRLYVETDDRRAGEIIEKALDEARDRLFGPEHLTPTLLESVLTVAQGHLDHLGEPGRRERHRIYHHIEIADGDVYASDGHGLPIDAPTRRHICCDAIVHPLITENGLPVSVGRSQRIVPERTRNIVLHRDGGCRVPGCDASHHLEIHHIVHWEDGGPTDTWNLIALCPRHHRLHHRGKLDITGNADLGTVRFAVDGRDLARDGPSPTPPDDRSPPGTYRAPAGEPIESRWMSFTHPALLTPRSA